MEDDNYLYNGPNPIIEFGPEEIVNNVRHSSSTQSLHKAEVLPVQIPIIEEIPVKLEPEISPRFLAEQEAKKRKEKDDLDR